ncbi:hypothetical protein [Chitinophaga sp. CF418]|uniref:hypothetical protein n=1 Tax=Chitinophaga sp. CF418 TaxID=1855287 RepID=UPI0009140C72|nr:hypothetical protein [Chitinophaga sp. CF418]SHN46125.1 hypothetical protein SAMN05216311_12316 [Chitinophaga sp. CF418]
MITRVILFIVFFFKVSGLLAQVNDTFVTVSPGLHLDRLKEKKEQILTYADSLNSYTQGALPVFLFDECFDTQASLWHDLHSPVSLRWKILKKVNNKAALKRILNTDDNRLDKKCSYGDRKESEFDIPMIDRSFRQLIRKRYDQLKEK